MTARGPERTERRVRGTEDDGKSMASVCLVMQMEEAETLKLKRALERVGSRLLNTPLIHSISPKNPRYRKGAKSGDA